MQKRLTAFAVACGLACGIAATPVQARTVTWFVIAGHYYNTDDPVARDAPCEYFGYGETVEWDGHDGWCSGEEPTAAAVSRSQPVVIQDVHRPRVSQRGSPVAILD